MIQFVADTSKAVRGIRDLTGQLGKVDKAGDSTDSTFGKLKGTWGKVAGVAAGVVPVVGAVAAALVDSAKAALEDQKQSEKLAAVLRTLPGATQANIDAMADWIDSMEIATGVADTDLRVAVQKLALATNNFADAQKLTTLAVDTAVGSGKSLSSVTDAISKAVNGNTSALKRQFPWLDTNKDGAVDLDEAMQGLTKAFGGAAKAAANNDPLKRLQAIFDQLWEAIGQALLPALQDFSDWLSDPKNQKKIREYIAIISALAKQIGGGLVSAIRAAIGFAEAMARAFERVQSAAESLKRVLGGGLSGAIGGALAGRSAAPATTGTRAAPTTVNVQPQPQAVLVTEEQIYRAVERLLLRGQSRNGRLARVG